MSNPSATEALTPVVFPSKESHPIQLEGRLHRPKGGGQWPAAVVCHPHPLGGGTMHNNVVAAIARALVARGVMALRFNFRGVGRSEGRYDSGQGERADVAGALDWLLAQPQVDPGRLSLAGYSFGAWIGLAHAQTDPGIAAVAMVGLPAWLYDAEFSRRNPPPRLGDGDLWQFQPGLMQSFARPKLFVTGEYDAFAPRAALERFVKSLPPPKSVHIVPRTDHFFQGRERKVGELVADYIAGL